MHDKLREIERKYERLTEQMADPAVISDNARFQKVGKERHSLTALVETYRAFTQVERELNDQREILRGGDAELRELVKEEIPALERRVAELESTLKVLLLPKDPNDDRNVILEIRAGAGGDEAGLFAAELLRSYLRHAERRGWRFEMVDNSESGAGGIKDATLSISGDAVYSNLKYESGVHRVQRVPATETQGRIHTSTVTVSVLPEAEDIDVHLAEADILFEKFRSTGAGGQSVNTTDSAVRLTHKPTGVIVKCQQEKSQQKNRAQAMKMLRAKLFEIENEKQRKARDSARKSQVGTGDRSEKIRTYNFPQDRLTDHRIPYTRHNLPAVMDGDIEDVLTACRTHFQALALQAETQAGAA